MFRLYRYASLQRNGDSDSSHCKPGTNRLMRTGIASFRSSSVTPMYGRLHSPHSLDDCERRACRPFGFPPASDGQLCVSKLRRATISCLVSVRPSTWDKSAPTGRSFMKFDIRRFFGNLSRSFKIHQNLTRPSGTLHVDLHTLRPHRAESRQKKKKGPGPGPKPIKALALESIDGACEGGAAAILGSAPQYSRTDYTPLNLV